MEPDVSFVGVKLLPGKLTNVGGSVNPESSIWTIHITQFALAAGAKPGKNTITLMQSDGESFALGTLEKDRCEQFQGDFMLSQEFQVLNQGKSEVHLTGYQTTTDIMDPEADLESDDDEEALADPNIVGRRRLAALKAMEAAANGVPEESDSEEDEDFDAEEEGEEEDDDVIDDDDDEDAEAPQALMLAEAEKLRQALKKGQDLQEADEEEESDSEELDEEEDEMLQDAALQGGSDEEEEDEDEDEEDDSDEEEEDSDVDLETADDKQEQAELQTASKILKQQKRSAEAGKATPQPSKKAKLDVPSPAVADGDKQWGKAIRAYLAKEGPTPLSNLGSNVKKPPGVNRKLKKLLEDNKEFSIDGKGVVSLSK